MRKIIGVAASFLVVCSLFLIVQPAFGASVYYGGAWAPVHDSGITIEYNSVETNYSFGVYDWDNFYGSDGGIGHTMLLQGSGSLGATLNFYEVNDDSAVLQGWWVSIVDSNDTSTDSPTQLWLGESKDIGFYFADSTGGNLNFFYDYEAYNSDDNYKIIGSRLNSTYVHTIDFVHDFAPTTPDAQVPIPTAILLLGSGLVGLAGFKRKMDD